MAVACDGDSVDGWMFERVGAACGEGTSSMIMDPSLHATRLWRSEAQRIERLSKTNETEGLPSMHRNRVKLSATNRERPEISMTRRRRWEKPIDIRDEPTAINTASLALIVSTLFTPVCTVPRVFFSSRRSLRTSIEESRSSPDLPAPNLPQLTSVWHQIGNPSVV